MRTDCEEGKRESKIKKAKGDGPSAFLKKLIEGKGINWRIPFLR